LIDRLDQDENEGRSKAACKEDHVSVDAAPPSSADGPWPSGPASFPTTRWSRILAARDGDPDATEARGALADLCRAYWYPLYAFIRRRGHDPEDTRDLTQEFFARLIEADFLAGVDRARGKFRSFLLAACTHFLSNRRDFERAAKRGGGRRVVSIDAAEAEGRYGLEPSHRLTPEALFARRWALTVLSQTLDRLRDEHQAAGPAQLARFEALRATLTGDGGRVPHAELAAQLGLTEGAVQVAVHRLRRRYREVLRNLIAATVEDPSEIDDEIRDLFAALAYQ
jgi:RNA polymerase sigma factor (sigma-70 family)